MRACGGIGLVGVLAQHFSSLAVAQLGVATVEHGEARPARGEVLWEADAAPPGATALTQHQRLWADGDRRVLDLDGEAVLEVSLSGGSVTHRHEGHAGAQLVAAVAIPLLAADVGVHVVHASAAVVGGGATLLIGPSGVGKSSLLVGLAEAGAAPLSEDACVFGATGDLHVWPGPPWVRLGKETTPPARWASLFDAADKRGWRLPDQPASPVPISRVVLLGTPGVDRTTWTSLAPEVALGRLVPHVTWLGAPRDRPAVAFRAAARLARNVPVWSLRMARHAAWVDEAVSLLTA